MFFSVFYFVVAQIFIIFFLTAKAANAVSKEFLKATSSYNNRFLKAAGKFMNKSPKDCQPKGFWISLHVGTNGFRKLIWECTNGFSNPLNQ
jgi:hypothetical protein